MCLTTNRVAQSASFVKKGSKMQGDFCSSTYSPEAADVDVDSAVGAGVELVPVPAGGEAAGGNGMEGPQVSSNRDDVDDELGWETVDENDRWSPARFPTYQITIVDPEPRTVDEILSEPFLTDKMVGRLFHRSEKWAADWRRELERPKSAKGAKKTIVATDQEDGEQQEVAGKVDLPFIYRPKADSHPLWVTQPLLEYIRANLKHAELPDPPRTARSRVISLDLPDLPAKPKAPPKGGRKG